MSSSRSVDRKVPADVSGIAIPAAKNGPSRGCILQQAYDVEAEAVPCRRKPFCACSGQSRSRVAYAQPSRRPADGRYGKIKSAFQAHADAGDSEAAAGQFQELYLDILQAIGIDLRQHDVKFEEDNWKSPTRRAWGIGWQVMLDGLRLRSSHIFSSAGASILIPVAGEITYGSGTHCGVFTGCRFHLSHRVGRDPETVAGKLPTAKCGFAGRSAVLGLQL